MIPESERAIESLIQEKNLTAPRGTPDEIEEKIVNQQYHQFPGTTTTVCCLTLENGFTVVGQSAAVSAANFDRDVGRKVAYEDARQKIWALEGYLKKQALFNP